MAFLGQEEQIREFQDRFRYLYVALFVGATVILSQLVHLQILQGDKMRQVSEENRIKRVKIPAPRGMIFDRERKLLIDNHPAFDLEIIPQYLKETRRENEVIALLSRLINMPEKEILLQLQRTRLQPSYVGVKIKQDLTRDEVAAVKSWQISMPGVEVKEEIKRTNIYGEIASHLLGYIGEVSQTELPRLNKEFVNYKLGDSIGKFGLEQKMETVLRGIDGEDLKEVDALGRVKLEKRGTKVIEGLQPKPAIPGKNLILTIDQDLQIAATQAFTDKIGALAAVDPRNGQILAMISRPSFDPTAFARGIPTSLWQKLLSNPNRPLRDKTIQDHYPPGSTFKVITAIAGLEEGAIDSHTRIHCTGSIRVGNRVYHCHKKGGHGEVDVVNALTKSCDVFFYRVSQKLKSVDDIAKWAFHLGLGKKTGIPLAREVPGLIPTEEWKLKQLKKAWIAGETLSVAIGQSFTLTTVLQLANSYAALANGGTLFRPYLVRAIESYEGQVMQQFQPEVLDRMNLKPETVELVKQGLWGVINSNHGTAYAQRLPGMDFAGKTGTAQVVRLSADKIYSKCENMRFQDRHHAIFVGFAPIKDPVISVAIIGEHACHGSSGAAPIARSVIKTYLEKFNPALYSEKVIAIRLKSEGQPTKPPAMTHSGAESEDLVEENNDNLPLPGSDRAMPLPARPTGSETDPEGDGTNSGPGTDE